MSGHHRSSFSSSTFPASHIPQGSTGPTGPAGSGTPGATGATGPTGPAGSGSGAGASVAFDLSTPSPSILAVLPAGSLVTRVSILITSVFDGSATLQVGTFASPGLFFDLDAETFADATTFDDSSLSLIAVSDSLVLRLVPHGATQGSGIVYYEMS